ncbi:MAG TPA: hemerythrin domain-containing protein [Rhodocyclaceae bacterium]|nr:hemerythrin domain-containing protein [Rhodocyclaceae bacterium]
MANDDPLITGHPLLDEEHRPLKQALERLDSGCATPLRSCTDCPLHHRHQCQSDLDEILTMLFGLVIDHFRKEELLMRKLPDNSSTDAHRENHQVAHADIAERLRRLVQAAHPDTIRTSTKALHDLVSEWLGRHIVDCDLPFHTLLAEHHLH